MTIRYVKQPNGVIFRYDGTFMTPDIDENDNNLIQWISEGNSVEDHYIAPDPEA